MRQKRRWQGSIGKIRSWEGSPFQIEGPTTEKARLCLVEVRANGTSSSSYSSSSSSLLPLLRYLRLLPLFSSYPLLLISSSASSSPIGVDFGEQPGPPTTEKLPCIHQLLTPFVPPQLCWFPQYFWQIYDSASSSFSLTYLISILTVYQSYLIQLHINVYYPTFHDIIT